MSPRNKPKRPTSKIVDSPLANKSNSQPRQDGRGVTVFRAERQFSGPLPPPEELAKYNDAILNGAERIMVMAEKQQDHRIALEKYVIGSDAKRADRGLIFGFIIAILVAGGGIYIISIGQDITGLAVIFVPLAALVGVFINTQKARKQEREAQKLTRTEKATMKRS